MESTSRELKKDLHRLIDIALRFGLEEEAAKPRHRLDDLEFGALVMIVGEGNFGKSSLINAIANRSIASTNVLPATTKVDIFTAAAAGQSHARIRRIGRKGWETLDIETARSVCRAEEERVRSGQDPELSDAVWAFADAEIPDSICLVDTPGIAQDLLGSLTARSIVSGFDVAYSVEDVWAYWIHRADIVLWVFEANRPESAETRRALERFLSVYDKPICPIATKIDRVAPERVAEVVRHFENTYRDLLETRRCDPLRCVCCAPGHARYGEGITQLRLRLRELAAEAVAIKETANREFVKQQARLLDRDLRAISEMIVGNLRTVALMGDECAVIFEQECAQMMDAVYHDVKAFTDVKRSHLVNMLPSLWDTWEGIGRGSGVETAMERAEADLLSVIDVPEIRALVTQRGTQFAEHIVRRCKVQSERWPVKSVRISNSGQVTEHSSNLSVRVPPVNVNVQVTLPTRDLRREIEKQNGCLLQISTVLGLLSALGLFLADQVLALL